MRWLRPEYQIPRFDQGVAGQAEEELQDRAVDAADAPSRLPWPATAVEQLGAVKAAAGRVGAELAAVMGAFEGADAGLVARHPETLVVMGEV